MFASVAICIAGSASAQEYWRSNYPYPADNYLVWEAVSSKYLVSYSDMAVRCDKLVGLTDFATQPARMGAWSGTKTTVTNTGNELLVTPTDPANYLFATCFFSNWDGPAPSESSVNMADYKRSGILVDMQPDNDGLHNAIVSGEIFVPELYNNDSLFGYPAFTFDIQLIDAHGHFLDYGISTVDTIKEFGQWVKFNFNYDNMQVYYAIGDAFSTSFNGMNYRKTNHVDSIVPLDFSNISGVSFLPLPDMGEKAYSTFDSKYTSTAIRFRNITIGAGTNVRTFNVESNGLTNKQYWPDNRCFDDWATVADKLMVGYHPDSALACTGLKGLTYFEPQDTLLYKDWHWVEYDKGFFNIEKKDSSMIVTPIPTTSEHQKWTSIFFSIYPMGQWQRTYT